MASSLSTLGLLAIASSLVLPSAVLAAPQLIPRDLPYEHKGCYASSTNGQRILSTATYADDDMTVASCAAFCTENNLKYFGLEYGRECYCGDSFPAGPALDASQCSFPCPGRGDPGQTCGAASHIDLYQNNLYAGRAPAALDIPYLGCFVDGKDRALPDNLLGADEMTAELCDAHCSDFQYFGVEYGRECWCGDITPKSQAPESECSFSCAGDNKQLCGAGERINVWARPWPVPSPIGDYTYKGCYTDRGDEHSLTGRVEYLGDMTPEQCGAYCDRYGYRYFGVEYGSQCFCGTEIKDVAEERPIQECSTKCGGDSSQRCGAADRLGIFEKPADAVIAPGNPPIAGAYSYKSCWIDDGAQRSLDGAEYRSDDMTVESCAAFCSEQNFDYFGVQYAHECYCGDELGGSAAPEEDCSHICAGIPTQFCGGANRLNIYSSTECDVQPPSSSLPPVSSSPAPSPVASSVAVSSIVARTPTLPTPTSD